MGLELISKTLCWVVGFKLKIQMPINRVVVGNHLVEIMSFYHVRRADITVLIGPDSLDVLHSVTTQSVSDLSDNVSIFASILNPNGRMTDRILIWNLVDQIALIHLEGCSESTRTLLSKSVSWKQDVKIIPLDSGFSSIWVYDLENIREDKKIIIDGQIHSTHTEDGVKIHLGPNNEINEFESNLIRSGITKIDDDGMQLFQIMNGQINGNIVRNYRPIPLEVSLSNDISFTKGCYTGQEIIARLDARGVLARTLVTFSSTNHLQSGNHKIIGGGRLVVYYSLFHDEKWMNLGLIHPDLAETGIEFSLDDIDCNIITKW
ncbi:MAG: hypothetical protein CMB31_02625 [Euryarchaeota archaeon]|nr:hypothetical protein [Euryarchaeota archaeon]